MTPPKRKVAYGRVSTEEQAENQHAAEQQITRLLKEGIAPADVFFDVESGASQTRPEFTRLVKLVDAGEIEEIIATRWDRVARNLAVYQRLKEILQANDVKLRLLDQGEVDFDSAAGELSADMQALLAVHELRMLRERVQRGHAHRRSRKAPFGRPPWGYRSVDERLELDTCPFICLLSQRPTNYVPLANLPDGSPELITGISKADIAREAVDLLFQLRSPRAVLKALSEKYGVRRKSHVVKGTGKRQGIEDILRGA
ncbi:MAG TPA: recombinase family protein [Trichocoleus sp.]